MSKIFLPVDEEADRFERTDCHVMIDIETMSVHYGAPVLTIGAVLFNPRNQDTVEVLEDRSLLIRVDVEDAVKHSEGVDGGTLRWWLSQDNDTIKALTSGDAIGVKAAMEQLRWYCVERGPHGDKQYFDGHSKMAKASLVWAKSPDFDCKHLEYMADSSGGNFPFRFYQYRCVRTIQDAAWPEGSDARPRFKAGALHDARADAVSQALTVQAAYLALHENSVELGQLPR